MADPHHHSSPHHADLAAAPITHTMPVPIDAAVEPDYLLLPDAPAVCIFEAPGDSIPQTLLLATTASARDLARRRLAPTPAEQRTSRADLRAICSGGRIHAIRVGSSLEADAVYLQQTRERLPHLAKIVAERWRAWFVHVDPDAEFPQWTKTNLIVGLVGKRSTSKAIGADHLPPGVFLGPLPDKDAAGRLIEAMIDCFDLCRFHNLLVQAPKASACAYKEMGRCAAPCDGTERMEDYRTRTRNAVELMGLSQLEPAITAVSRECATLMEAGDERRAAEHGKLATRLSTLRKPGFAHIASLAQCARLLLLPSTTPKHVRFVLAHRGRLISIADVDPADESAVAAAAAAADATRLAAPPLAVDAPVIDTIAITTRWLFMPEKKRRGEMFRLDVQTAPGPERPAMPDQKALLRAAKSVLLRTKPGEPTVDAQEIEGA